MKTALENDLLKALADLEQAVKSMATAKPKPDLLPLFKRIDDLAKQLPPDTHPNLLHFMQKKSHEKARLFLEGRISEITKGACGR